MRHHLMSFSARKLSRLVPVLWGVLVAGGTTGLLAQPADGTYQGTTDQGRSISVTVSGGQITSWTVSYLCPGFSSTVTVSTSCSIVGNSFTCGSTFCAPFAATTRISGTFSGTSVSGSLTVRHQPNTFASCCSLTNRSWSASSDGGGGGGGTCEPAAALACGASDTGSNAAAGSTDAVDAYACNMWDYSGPEYAYTFQPASNDTVTVALSGLTDDLDLLVLQDAGGCDPDSCLADSTNVGTGDESVTWDAVAGETYHIVVDGFAGATGNYSIRLLCSEIFVDGFESGNVSAWSSSVQ